MGHTATHPALFECGELCSQHFDEHFEAVELAAQFYRVDDGIIHRESRIKGHILVEG
jgi:hypothetical protein